MQMLLDKLAEKGHIQKINYGVTALCPKCQSPVHMRTITCLNCDSSKLQVKHKMTHLGCGFTGYTEEYIDGINLRCPECEEIPATTDLEKLPKTYKIDGPFFYCQECGKSFNTHRTQFNCIQCKTRFYEEETQYENLNGYIIHPSEPKTKEIPTMEQSLEEVQEEPEKTVKEEKKEIFDEEKKAEEEKNENDAPEEKHESEDPEKKISIIEKLFGKKQDEGLRIEKEVVRRREDARILLIENNEEYPSAQWKNSLKRAQKPLRCHHIKYEPTRLKGHVHTHGNE
jgi:hypothetical protein